MRSQLTLKLEKDVTGVIANLVESILYDSKCNIYNKEVKSSHQEGSANSQAGRKGIYRGDITFLLWRLKGTHEGCRGFQPWVTHSETLDEWPCWIWLMPWVHFLFPWEFQGLFVKTGDRGHQAPEHQGPNTKLLESVHGQLPGKDLCVYRLEAFKVQ